MFRQEVLEEAEIIRQIEKANQDMVRHIPVTRDGSADQHIAAEAMELFKNKRMANQDYKQDNTENG